MSNSTIATVETLTAEVRVLMVGSRQVTLSVYGQLDNAEFDEIESFGRVHPRDAHMDYIYLVGRHRQTGALVRATVPGGPNSVALEYEWREYRLEMDRAASESHSLQVEVNFHRKYEDDYHKPGVDHRCYVDDIADKEERIKALAVTTEGLRREYDETVAPAVAQAAELKKLPLIVLAGLR